MIPDVDGDDAHVSRVHGLGLEKDRAGDRITALEF
jgi:hypothetical protein